MSDCDCAFHILEGILGDPLLLAPHVHLCTSHADTFQRAEGEEPCFKRPVTVRFAVAGMGHDRHGLAGCFKSVLDALGDLGVLLGDGPRWVREVSYGVLEGEPRTEIVITEIDW